jgi:hypothetical protein
MARLEQPAEELEIRVVTQGRARPSVGPIPGFAALTARLEVGPYPFLCQKRIFAAAFESNLMTIDLAVERGIA